MQIIFHLRIWNILLYLWYLFAPGENCTQLEEGKQGELSFISKLSYFSSVTVEVEHGGDFIEIAYCPGRRKCHNAFPSKYICKHESLDNPHLMKQRLIITNVTRNEVNFRWLKDRYNVFKDCKLEVYVNANKPTCEAPYETEDHMIALTCATDRVYPDVKCSFSHSLQGHIKRKVTIKTYPSPIRPDDLGAVCTLVIDPQGLTLKAISASIVFYPRALEGKPDKNRLKLPPINLAAPTVSLGSDCPKDYIALESNATCTCQLSSPGFPRGQAQWYDRFNSPVGTNNSQNGSSVLELEYNATDPPKFECRGDTVLNTTTMFLAYSLSLAYGPSEILIETEGGTFNLCSSKYLVIPITCKVDHSQINPYPLFTILFDNNVQVEMVQGQLISTYYQYTYLFTPSSSVIYYVTCQVQNSAISTLVLSNITLITVREPPQSAPLLTTSKGKPESGVVTVTGMKEVEVTCRIDGGSPRVKQMTLSCGQNKTETFTWTATLHVQIRDGFTEQRCYCSAVHVTGCYNKVAELILHQGNVWSSTGHNDIALPAGIGVGMSALIIIVIVIVFVVYYAKRRTTSPCQTTPSEYQVIYDKQSEEQIFGEL